MAEQTDMEKLHGLDNVWATWTGAAAVHWVESGITLCGFPRVFQVVVPPDADQVCRTCRRMLDKRQRLASVTEL